MARIGYTIKRSHRAKAMRIEVYPDGRVVLIAPHFFGIRAIEHFAAKYAGWVERMLARNRGREVIRIRRSDIAALKASARTTAEARCKHFAALLGVSYRGISVGAQRSRWGSCSHDGSLRFNYRIAALPEVLRDYVVIHELCHRIEMNHSKAFWARVATLVPGHRELRKRLRNVVFVFE